MNLLRTILIVSAATAATGFVAPSSTAASSTRLHGTGDGGQRQEDEAMFYAPPKKAKDPKTAANSQLPSRNKNRFQQSLLGIKSLTSIEKVQKKAAPKKAAPKKAAPKKAAPKKVAAKKAAPKKVVKKAAPKKEEKKGGFSFGKLGGAKKAAPVAKKEEAPKKKSGFQFGKL